MRGAHEKVVWSGVYAEEEKILREQQKTSSKGRLSSTLTPPPALIVVIFRALSPSFTNKPLILASRLIIIFDKKNFTAQVASVPN